MFSLISTHRQTMTAAIATMASLLSLSAHAGPNLITNGSFQSTSAYDPNNAAIGANITNSNLTGWSVTSCLANGCSSTAPAQNFTFLATPSTAANGIYGTVAQGSAIISFYSTPGVSADGGNAITEDAGNQTAALYQTVSGLTIGDSYLLTFYQATMLANGATPGAFTGAWNVYFGTGSATNAQTSPTAVSTAMYNPTNGNSAWTSDTIALTATAASETLAFFATTSSGQPPFLLLDGVSLTDAGPAAVPEPASLALVAVGLLGLVMLRRRRATHA
jgi:hypothetical protein